MIRPYYDRGGITIYCGECSQVIEWLISEGVLVDLTVTSPPYDNLRDYQGYTFPFKAIATGLWGITTVGGVVVWVVGDQTIDGSETGTSFRQALYFKAMGFKLHDTMIYQTDKPPMNDNRYQASFEYMLVFCKKKVKTFNPILVTASNAGIKRKSITYREKDGKLSDQWREGKTADKTIRGNIWYIKAGYSKSTKDKNAYNHPAIFPEALAHDHIISWSNESDLVLDPMMGSGTTLKMAQQLGRRAIGIDISEEYCKIAVERLRQPSFFSIPAQQDKPKPIQGSLIDD